MHDIWFASKIILLLKGKISEVSRAKSVTVNVVLSPFTHVTRESLSGAFEMLSSKEKLGNVDLNITTAGISVKCGKCGITSEVTKPIGACPKCGSADLEIGNVEEFVIESLEIR